MALSNMELLNCKLHECRTGISSVMKHLKEFQELLHEFYFPEKPDPEEAHALHYLRVSRDASAILCQQLSRICPRHPTHQVYFSLNVERQPTEALTIGFFFGFQRTDDHGDGVVWIKADSSVSDSTSSTLGLDTTREKEGSAVVIPSNSTADYGVGAKFCPGRLTHSMDFEFWVGASRLLSSAPRGSRPCDPVRLSDWIKTYRDRHSRIRLARLIAEAVLKLSPTLWTRSLLGTIFTS